MPEKCSLWGRAQRTPAPILARRLQATVAGGILCLCPLLAGCVERWLEIRSEPSRALVFLDGREVGRTPLRIPMVHYGTHEVLLYANPSAEDEGPPLAMASRIITLHAPWYQWFPLDLLTEHLWPGTLVDTHLVEITLPPLSVKNRVENFLKSAEAQGIEVSPAAERP